MPDLMLSSALGLHVGAPDGYACACFKITKAQTIKSTKHRKGAPISTSQNITRQVRNGQAGSTAETNPNCGAPSGQVLELPTAKPNVNSSHCAVNG